MKMKKLTLKRYSYERFLELAEDFILDKVSHDGQGWFLMNAINCISEETFLDWIKHDLTLVLVIDSTARKEIPIQQRYAYAEDEDAAFILYRP